MDNIKCPKCGSTQLTTDKKGFSGKKAVAGAILTGGIGLLAGTIGSNKIIITCLSCGKQFRPGEDMETKNTQDAKRREINAKIARNPVFKTFSKIVFGLLFVVILIVIIISIFTPSNNKTVPAATSTIDSTDHSGLDKYYVIEKEDDRTPIINLYIYASINDSSKIKLINESLISKYNAESKNFLDITYFNKKGIGKIYQDKLNNDKTSDKEADKLYSHMIANYSFNPSTGYVKLWFAHCK